MTQQLSPQEILDMIAKAQKAPIGDPRLAGLVGFEKSTFAQPGGATTGLQFYDLELGAKVLYPVLTPLRNMIPRVSGKGGIQASWRAITGINVQGMRIGVSGGNRGGVQAIATKDYTASYKGFGLETNVDFEAQYAAQGFDDLRAIAAKSGLEATMLGEESWILGGNTSVALGLTPTPTLAASAAGGSLATATLSVICVALGFQAVINGSVAGGVQGQITRTNADGSSDVFGGGSARQSANATVGVTGPTGSVTASVAPVSGALGYAWFWGRGRFRDARRAHDHQLGHDHGGALGHADRRVARRGRQLDLEPRVRRPALPGPQGRLGRLRRVPADRHRRRRHAAHGGRRRRRGRDRRRAEEHVGPLPAVARHHVGQQPGGAQHL